ncbi:hypothetical protein A5712_21620 [Mycobacterium sp. E2327]|nr:hypothetical protein A5712_21620 [Mycobacterium sp. E2327]
MEQGGFSRSEAERLEALMLRCDEAAEKAAATGDEQLLEYTIATGQGCIDALTASFFVERRLQALRSATN